MKAVKKKKKNEDLEFEFRLFCQTTLQQFLGNSQKEEETKKKVAINQHFHKQISHLRWQIAKMIDDINQNSINQNSISSDPVLSTWFPPNLSSVIPH